MVNRRIFLKELSLTSFALVAGSVPLSAFVSGPEFTKITILHTNDVHSRIEPFPDDGSRNAGRGGVARRAALLKKIRAQEENVLLFDSGDIFQGTPYFNFFGGELEMKLMTEMGYDAGTMGNHDFDAGIDGFEKQLIHADFPILNANYDFTNTILNGKIHPYKIFTVDGIKIGVFGLGIELKGLVPKTAYLETQYLDPLEKGEATASLLKNELNCDYVICLSHLGYKYDASENKVSDHVLANETQYIDLILGGHTNTFLNKPDIISNDKDHLCLVNQAGWAGIMLGRIDLVFERNRKGKCTTCSNLYLG